MDSETRVQLHRDLRKAIAKLGRPQVARELHVSPKTLARWQDKLPDDTLKLIGVQAVVEQKLLFDLKDPAEDADFRFIDLFAGIGGTRLGFESAGGGCVFTSEWDKFATQTYECNFPDGHPVHGDIKEFTGEGIADAELDERIPDHDVLVAGFPCQPFSIAGVSKKNSLNVPHGFECKTQGTLFFDVARILKVKKPAAFMLENVKNLERHNKGHTFTTIMETLREELGYQVSYRVIDAQHFVPQHRERIFIVGFREPTAFDFDELELPSRKEGPKLEAILHPQDGSEKPEGHFTEGEQATIDPKYNLTAHLWRYLRNYKKKHAAAGNGFGYSKVDGAGIARTLSARYHKDGSEILIDRGGRKNPRRLTPRECARLMGFPDEFDIIVSDTQAYRQFGNSVVVPCIEAVAAHLKPHLMQILKPASGRRRKRKAG